MHEVNSSATKELKLQIFHEYWQKYSTMHIPVIITKNFPKKVESWTGEISIKTSLISQFLHENVVRCVGECEDTWYGSSLLREWSSYCPATCQHARVNQKPPPATDGMTVYCLDGQIPSSTPVPREDGYIASQYLDLYCCTKNGGTNQIAAFKSCGGCGLYTENVNNHNYT